MRFSFRLKKDPDPFAPHRYDGVVKSVRERGRRHMRHWWQWVLLSVLLLIVAAGIYTTVKYYRTQGKVQTDLGQVAPVENEAVDPFNVLLVGSDSREGLTEEEQHALGAAAVGGERADTLILAHVDPQENTVILVQFPRDLYVELPGKGTDKINSALAYGPDYLVRTVKALTGLQINKYVQVNIAGFRELVDAIGGVSLCITEPIPFDPNTGIEVTEEELGMVEFDGDRALRFVRSRNFPTGDFERIRNQQRFVAAALNKVTSPAIIADPRRIDRLFNVAADHVTTDSHTTLNGLRSLGERLRNFDPERYEAYVAPNLGITNINGASVILPDEPALEIVFEAIEDNESPAAADGVPDIEPSTVSVGVYNGTGEEGLAASAGEQLVEATDIGEGPVRVVEIGEAKRLGHETTVVTYDPDKPETEAMAELVAAAIPGAELEEGNVPKGVDVEVIVGERFATEKLVQVLPIALPAPSATPAECR